MTALDYDTGDESRKLGVLGIILAVSLFAVSFPGLSKRAPFLRIPGLVFFIGKHFGTGVILATAFIHLLSDAYSSLQKEEVTKRYGPVGKWTGCIILGSLLAIFLVEYVSTLFVEHLNDQPSAPSTPADSREGSVAPGGRVPVINIDENTPLLVAPPPQLPRDEHHHHHHDHKLNPAAAVLPAMALNGVPIELLTGSPRVCRLGIAHISQHHHHHDSVKKPVDEEGHNHGHGHGHVHAHEHEHAEPRIGRKRQVIGILVLQLGIMIHSLVIGMTLVVTYGSDFTSLTTAIIFHQLFEGLSLGIRIAALPPAKRKSVVDEEDDDYSEDAFEPHDHASGGQSTRSSSIRSSSSKRPLSGFARLSRSLRCLTSSLQRVQWLKPTMAILFGITTPAGMGLGMLIWGSGSGSHQSTPAEEAAMSLVQGVMSAVSAGLLIYASTVEMVAGDFVYGDVDGGHHHHHHHHEGEHEHEHEHGHAHQPEHQHEHEHERGCGGRHGERHRPEQQGLQEQCSKHAGTHAGTTKSLPHPLSKSVSAEYGTTSPSSHSSDSSHSSQSHSSRSPHSSKAASPSPSPPEPALAVELPDGTTAALPVSLALPSTHPVPLPSPRLEEPGTLPEPVPKKAGQASLQKRLLALGSLFAGVGMMVLVGLGE